MNVNPIRMVTYGLNDYPTTNLQLRKMFTVHYKFYLPGFISFDPLHLYRLLPLGSVAHQQHTTIVKINAITCRIMISSLVYYY